MLATTWAALAMVPTYRVQSYLAALSILVTGMVMWVPLRNVGADRAYGFIPVVGWVVATYLILRTTRPRWALLLTLVGAWCGVSLVIALWDGYRYRPGAAPGAPTETASTSAMGGGSGQGSA